MSRMDFARWCVVLMIVFAAGGYLLARCSQVEGWDD